MDDEEPTKLLGQWIDKCNAAYAERNMCVALLAQYAQWFGHKVGIKVDPNEEAGWQHILFIDLPTGQVSWHLQDSELVNFPGLQTYDGEWDGHTTEEKYERVKRFIYLGKASRGLSFTK